MSVFGLLSALLFAVRRPARPSPVTLKPAERKPTERKPTTFSTRFCGLPHLLATGEPVAHACHVLPAEAVRAEAEGRFLIALRIMGRLAASGPLRPHPGIWRIRRR